ncbi:hypothetical protein Tco_0222361 [Tanacetum coccineum]
MHQFWATVSKHKASYLFKIDNKKFSINVEVFREILNICPKVSGKEFDEPPTEEEALSFIHKLGHSGEIRYISDAVVDHLHQPWRTFASIRNKCLYGKDLAYQIDNIDSKKQDKMFYPRFIKIIIHHFLTKDKPISWRNKMFMHTARDDSVLGTMRFVSRHANTQVYGEILPKAIMNQALLDSVAYKACHVIAIGSKPPMPRKGQKKSEPAISSEESPSKNGSCDGNDFELEVSDEQHLKTTSANEGTGTIPGVPNVPKYESKSEKESWGDSGEEDEDDENDSKDNSDDGDDDDDGNDGNDGNDNDDDDDANDDDNQECDDTYDDDEETDSNRTESDRIKILVINQSTTKYYEEEEEKIDDEEIMDDEEDDEVTKELYDDVNVNLGNEDTNMTNADQADNEIALLMETSARNATVILPQAVSDFANPVIEKNVIESLEAVVLTRSSSQLKSTYEAAASLSEFELTKILLDKMEESKSHLRANYKKKLYDALVESYNTEKDLFNTYGEVLTLKRSRDDNDKDRDPSAGSDRETKRRKSSKEAESSKNSRSKEEKSSRTSKDASQSQHKSFSMSAHAEVPSYTVDDSGVQQDQEFDMVDNILTPELLRPGLVKLLVLKNLDFFINNDLEYLKGGDLSKRYSTSVTKTKAATYEIKWIEDLVQNLWSPVKKLTHLIIDEWYALNVALCMFTRRIVIQRRVEDLQLGVESYQKKLNLTKPDTFRSNLRNRTTYTTYSDPKGVIYKDQNNKNRLMRVDELHKFSDGTLDDVRSALNDIAKGIRMEYLPKRKWSDLDKRRARVMIQDIDKQLYERRLMRNLEKLVGGREYENDLRLLEQII